MTELRKCPFCGGEAGIYKRILDWATWDYKIACSKCRCETDIYDTKQEAIEAWNKRVPQEVSQDWFRSLPTKDKEKLFKYISEKCQKCGEENDKRYKR